MNQINPMDTRGQQALFLNDGIVADCHTAPEVERSVEYLCSVTCDDYYYRHTLQLPPNFACTVDSSQYEVFEAHHNCSDVSSSYDEYKYDKFNYCQEEKKSEYLVQGNKVSNIDRRVCAMKVTFTTGPSLGSDIDCMKLTVLSRMTSQWLTVGKIILLSTLALTIS